MVWWVSDALTTLLNVEFELLAANRLKVTIADGWHG
jgi:hypothetical protein